MSLPSDFRWGTATCSTQVEGAAPAATWARWEDVGRAPRSGEGNAFATNYARDFDMLTEYRLPHLRITLEWARIERAAGVRDQQAIDHYTDVLRSARELGVEVWATLQHYSLPGWFDDDEGGFREDRSRSYFWARHVDLMGELFGDLVAGWIPVHDPVGYARRSWLTGELPPGRTDPEQFPGVLRAVHLAAFDAWRLLRSGGRPVATALQVIPLEPAVRSRAPDEREMAAVRAGTLDELLFGSWVRALRDGVLEIPGTAGIEVPDWAGAFDLVGVGYDHALAVYADGTTGPYPTDARVGPLGTAPWTEGLGLALRRLHDELPGRRFLVTGCGVATPADDPLADEWRTELLRGYVDELVRAVDDGVPVVGFFHRSSVDGYEWAHGFDVQWGLFDRDRKPKGSALALRDLIAARTG